MIRIHRLLLLPFLLAGSQAFAINNATTRTLRANLRRIATTTSEEEYSTGEIKDNSRHRYLMGGHHHGFVPLSCNPPTCDDWTTWTAEDYNPNDGTAVVIPCGQCVTMDYPGDMLVLSHGLDIQGTLDFPDGYNLTIEAPFVRVQGVLSMTATQPVTDLPSVKFLLSGGDESVTDFVPAGENVYACSEHHMGDPEPCSVGAKAIVVAGGRLDIRGLKEECDTWVTLHDVASSMELPQPTAYTKLPEPDPNHPNEICRSLDPYMQEDFESSLNQYGWTGGYGAPFEITGRGTFRVFDRNSDTEHGPTWDLLHVRDCLIPNQKYLFSARVRLTKPSEPRGTPTTCAELGTNCLELQSTARFETSQANRRKGWEKQEDGFEYGRWQDFYTTFDFTEEELDPTAIYHIFQLRGPEPDVEIEMDDVTFSLPPVATVPDPSNVCGGNLIINGEAEASSIHPYPLESFGGCLTVETGGAGNNYFHVTNRNSDGDSIAYYMDAPGCIVAGARYNVSARVRVRSSRDVATELSFRAFFTDGTSTKYTVASCPPSQRSLGFVQCESEFAVANDFDSEHVERIRFTFETVGGPTYDVDVAAWSLEFVEGPKDTIIVPEVGVDGCWDEGAEILITSHTIDFESSQVRRLASAPEDTGDGHVRIELDDSISSPVTEQDGDGFAVEVALLSRNIMFLGATDEDDHLLGGHLIVLHTPAVPQVLSGVEIDNFGRQGELGRYPIHFHMSSNVDGALVSKNTIRNSNQRCVVVHGTYNVTVAENVAYETKGHCFMIEDGGEIDNSFIRNLGASTRAAVKTVRPIETDNTIPSTFWCSNPMNTWIENVAAGSESSGFWFELDDAVRPPSSFLPLSNGMVPRLLPLKLFRGNVAHSNWRHGLRTYPNGFLPPNQAIFDNTKSYKNRLDGIFFHNSADLLIQGGILADNGIQADFDRADDIVINGTSIIGMTTRYKDIVNTQLGTLSHDDIVVGIELHNFATDRTKGGAMIRNVQFSGFSETGSTDTALIRIDGRMPMTGNFDYWTTIQGVQMADDVTPFQFDFRDAISNGIAGAYLVDIDSSMKPAGSSASGTSTIVSNTPEATAFLDLTRCESFDEAGYLYCSNTCLRTITFAVNPSGTGNYLLQMADMSDPTKSFSFPGKFYREFNEDGERDETSNTDLRKLRYFAAALPPGDYLAQFVYGDNSLAWPTFVETTIEPTLCAGSVEVDNVQLEIPQVSNAECRELIKNGDMEASSSSYPRWLHFDSGIELVSGAGIEGSNAIADTDQSVPSGEIGQYIDVRCLTEGTFYEVRAWVRLERNGAAFGCDSSDCPSLRLRMRTQTDERGEEFSYSFVNLADLFVRPYDGSGWNLLHGWFKVDAVVSNADSVALVVERGRTNIKMFLDDISMSIISEDCSDLVFNGDLSSESSIFWEKDTDAADLEMTSIEYNPALKMVGRSSDKHSITQNIRTGCMIEGHRYIAFARVRVLNSDGSLFECGPTSRSGQAVCPRMRLRSFVNFGLPTQDAIGHDGNSIAETDHGVTQDEWYTMSGVFVATNYDEHADKSILSFEDAPANKDLVIDDVSIIPLPKNCSQLILNGAAEGETVGFWRHWINNDGMKIELVPSESGGHALKVSNRARVGDGITQTVDPRCMTIGSVWKLAAKMKLLSRSSGEPVVCDPLETVRVASACPPVRVAGFQSGSKEEDEKYFMVNEPTWMADAWNEYEVEFTVSSTVASSDRVVIAIRNYNLEWDMLVTDISVTPL